MDVFLHFVLYRCSFVLISKELLAVTVIAPHLFSVIHGTCDVDQVQQVMCHIARMANATISTLKSEFSSYVLLSFETNSAKYIAVPPPPDYNDTFFIPTINLKHP